MLVEASRKRGEARARRRRTRAEVIDNFLRASIFSARTDGGGGEAEHDGPPEWLAGVRCGLERRQSPETLKARVSTFGENGRGEGAMGFFLAAAEG